MARTNGEAPLEIIRAPAALPADGSGRGRRRLARAWLAVAVSVVLVSAGLAGPVRTTLAVDEVRGLARRWSWFASLERERGQLAARLGDDAQDATNPAVAQGAAALAGEEAALLVRGRAKILSGPHLPDGGLRRLRLAMAAALADQADDLAGLAGAPRSLAADRSRLSTPAARDLVTRLLDGQLARWRQRPVKGVAAPVLHAADPELIRLAAPSDQPVGARLVLTDRSGRLTSVDLGGGRGGRSAPLVANAPGVLTGPVVVRTGYLAVGATAPFPDQATVYAVAAALTAAPGVIGATFADTVVAAAEPDGIWLESGNEAVEVNGTGSVMRRPVTIGTGRIVVGATERLLVTTGIVSGQATSELDVVPIDGPEEGRPEVLTTHGQLVAAIPGQLAWLDTIPGATSALRLADGAGRGVRTVSASAAASPVQAQAPAEPVGGGAFSPDGDVLAVRYRVVTGGREDLRLGLVDVPTGTSHLVEGSLGDQVPGAMAWTPEGDRVFFTEALAARTRIGMWAVGDPGATVVRVAAGDLVDLAVTGP